MIAPALLLRAYREGLFPMALDGGQIGWFSPDPRGVVPLDRVQAPRRLLRTIRRQRWEVTIDESFDAVIEACADRRDEGTWISAEIVDSYVALHRLGFAHSVEIRQGDRLVGGLYGVHLGGAFFGESMFHRERDASKAALVVLVDRLRQRGFSLLDVQWVTPHLARFGAVEVPRAAYLRDLRRALALSCRFVD